MKTLKMVTLLLLKREGFLQRLRLKKCTLDVFCCHLMSSFCVINDFSLLTVPNRGSFVLLYGKQTVGRRKANILEEF